MTAAYWWVVAALAVGSLFAGLTVGLEPLRAAARWVLRLGRPDPDRPLGWYAALAELEALPELPVERYGDEALRVEMEASTAEVRRLADWVKAEPRDREAQGRLERVLSRHRDLLAELDRRIELDAARLEAKLDAMPPGPHDHVVEERAFGDRKVRSHVLRCCCEACLDRLPLKRDTLALAAEGTAPTTEEPT